MPDSIPPALIEIRGVTKVYSTPAGDFSALKEVNLDFYPGEFVAILGKSGSGKSTLANMITGIDHPTRGQVSVAGHAIHGLKEGRMSVWRGNNLGIVFQFFQLLPMLTVLENVMVPMDFCKRFLPDEREQRGLMLLRLVGMEEYADKLPSEISGGQQQSVAIARALANDPPILIADEPTGNLDSKTAGAVFELLESLVAEGKTIIMVTHDQSLARRATRAVLLVDGEVIPPVLAAAFASLPHRLLLELAHSSVPHRLAAGETGAPGPGLAFITAGHGQVWPPGQPCRAGDCLHLHLTATLAASPEAELAFLHISAGSLAALAGKYEPLRAALEELPG